MTSSTLAPRLKEEGHRLGLVQVGIARPGPSEHGAFYRRWLASGFAGGMEYLGREESVARRLEPTRSLPGGPLLERELGRRAGLGWFGRNTMLIHPRRGSYFFLGVLLTTVELEPDPPFAADRCGSCRACLDACPTGALLGRDEDGAPVMDARLCISYLTIEHRGSIPEALRPLMGNRVFGCDICQEVCPWNRRFGDRAEPDPEYAATVWPGDREGDPAVPSLDGPELVELTERILVMSGKEYRRVFAASPLARPGRKGMLRNLCVALGNYGAKSGEAGARVRPVLERAAQDRSELVREHAVWALGLVRSG
ncbi:MAG: tRNA epoxyqueuosine(34) reductase QueG [Gemmatimonadota bacterium]